MWGLRMCEVLRTKSQEKTMRGLQSMDTNQNLSTECQEEKNRKGWNLASMSQNSSTRWSLSLPQRPKPSFKGFPSDQVKCPKANILCLNQLIMDLMYKMKAFILKKKAEEPEIKLPTPFGSYKKPENSRKPSTSTSLTMLKSLTV